MGAGVRCTRADVVEDARDVGVVLAAAVVEADRAVATVEPGSAEVRFEHADAMGDSGTGASVPERGVSMWFAKVSGAWKCQS